MLFVIEYEYCSKNVLRRKLAFEFIHMLCSLSYCSRSSLQERRKASCYKCKQSLECFITRNWDKLQEFRLNLKFESNVQDHYFPSAWLCKASTTRPPIHFIKYRRSDELFDEIKGILVEDNVEENVIK